MTYKAIVQKFVEDTAKEWLEKLLKSQGIPVNYLDVTDISLDNTSMKNTVLWEMYVGIDCNKLFNYKIIVGGTVDDFFGVCCSVIWDRSKEKRLWFNNPETRETFGITELKLE